MGVPPPPPFLGTNSSKTIFEENIRNFKSHLTDHERGYPITIIEETLSEVNFEERKQSLLQKQKDNRRILPFVTQYHPTVHKQILMKKWHLIKQQPLLNEFFKEPLIILYRRGAVTKRYTRESQAMKKAKHMCWSRAGLSTPFYKTEISNELKALFKNLFLKLASDKMSGRTCRCILSWVLGL